MKVFLLISTKRGSNYMSIRFENFLEEVLPTYTYVKEINSVRRNSDLYCISMHNDNSYDELCTDIHSFLENYNDWVMAEDSNCEEAEDFLSIDIFGGTVYNSYILIQEI